MVKIGYMRWCLPMELDVDKAKANHVNVRFLKELTKHHDVVLYSVVKARDRWMFDQEQSSLDKFLTGPKSTKNDWVKKIDYRPDEMPSADDVDLLYVENGSTNIQTFRMKNGESRIYYNTKQLGAFEGLVLLQQWDSCLGYTWDKLFNRKIDWDKQDTISKDDWENQLCWSNKRYIKNKRFVMLFPATEPLKCLQATIFNGNRCKFAKNFTEAEYLPHGWDFEDDMLPVSEEKDNFMIYAGNPKKRMKKMLEYFSDVGHPVDVYGPKWDKGTKKFGKNVTFHCDKYSASDIRKFTNRSVVQMTINDESVSECGWMVIRPLETTAWGAIALIEDNNPASANYVNDDFIVVNAGDIKGVLDYISELSIEEQREIIHDQRNNMIKKFNMKRIITKYLDPILKKYGVM